MNAQRERYGVLAMIERFPAAVEGICECLDAFGFMSLESIDRVVFMDFADRPRLQTALAEMSDKGLIVRVSNGCYRLTEKGKAFLDGGQE